MIDIRIPSDNLPLAAAIGRALAEYGAGEGPVLKTLEAAPLAAATAAALESATHTAGGPDDTAQNNEGDQIGGDDPADKSKHVSGDDTAADNNGVLKNDAFCSSAAKPFYASGARSGQWKKRQGVEDAAYDAWYAAELAKVQSTTDTGSDSGTVDTAGAFGGGDAAPAGNTETVPHDSGTLMAWVAERQTAGLTSQADVNTAWENCDLSMTDIFAPNPPEVIAENCARIYHRICKLAAA